MKKISIVLLAMLFVLSIAVAASATQVYVDGVTQATGWLDVNKTWIDDGLLCWAASASNILAYTGWIGAPDLSSTNQIFDDFKAHWNNDVGTPIYAIQWWFDGVNPMQGRPLISAQLTDFTHTGFYTTTLFNDNIRSAVLDSDFETTISHYVNGDVGISLKIAWSTGSHFLTLWGIDTATDQIFITDSDDDGTVLQAYAYDPTTRQLNYRGASRLMTAIYGLELWGADDPGPTPRPGGPVPEPNTMLLLGSGLLGLWGARKKFKK